MVFEFLFIRYKKCAFLLLMMTLEIISVVLEKIRGSNRKIRLALFLLSLIGFTFTINAIMCYKNKCAGTQAQWEEMEVVEIVFSVIQVVGSLSQLILILSGKKTYDVCLHALASVIISLLFAFKKYGGIVHTSSEDPVSEHPPTLLGSDHIVEIAEPEVKSTGSDHIVEMAEPEVKSTGSNHIVEMAEPKVKSTEAVEMDEPEVKSTEAYEMDELEVKSAEVSSTKENIANTSLGSQLGLRQRKGKSTRSIKNTSAVEILSKNLTQTGVTERLAFPTRALHLLPPFGEGMNFLTFLVKDVDEENVWDFRCIIRSGRYRNPVITGEWLDFARYKGLAGGDLVIFYKLNEKDEASGAEYAIQAIKSTPVTVHMQGIAVGRAVDLTRFDNYDDLLKKLEEMFDIEGELCGSSKKWQVVYTDDEDDMMRVGDDPWHEFCSMVRKIFIYTAEEVKKLLPKIRLSANEEVKPTKPDLDTVMNTEDQSSIIGPGC